MREIYMRKIKNEHIILGLNKKAIKYENHSFRAIYRARAVKFHVTKLSLEQFI